MIGTVLLGRLKIVGEKGFLGRSSDVCKSTQVGSWMVDDVVKGSVEEPHYGGDISQQVRLTLAGQVKRAMEVIKI
jgi:hypothetical protein